MKQTRRGHYFETLKDYCEWLYSVSDTRKSYNRFINAYAVDELNKMMVDENQSRFDKRANASKNSIKSVIQSGKHISTQLNIEAINNYERIFELIGEVFTNKDISDLLKQNGIEGHNNLSYKSYWIKTNKIKSVYKPKNGSNQLDVEIYQKIDKNGKCSTVKLKEYRASFQLVSKQMIKSNEIMNLIIEDLPETFTYKEVESILTKHGKGPMYIKDVIAKYPHRFELIGTVAAKKPEGRGGNKAQNLYKKLKTK